MKKALVVGGSSGVGLSLVLELLNRGYDFVYIVAKHPINLSAVPQSLQKTLAEKTSFQKLDLTETNFDYFDTVTDIDTLIITAGFGRVAPFEDLDIIEIDKLVKCNMLAPLRIIKKYYHKIHSANDFYCAVLGSFAGHVSSPLFSVYGSSKAGLCRFIENINAELHHDRYKNRILDVSPGSLAGTGFNGSVTNIAKLSEIANEILDRMIQRDILYIPHFETTYQEVLNRYHSDPVCFGNESYDYKIKNGRINTNKQIIIGYLSGTFDLFHIGHLNLLRRAKEQCDYLIVGVHESGSWKGKETFIPFEERRQIVENIQYVDMAIQSFQEDSDAYDALHYDKLFVGSDYKGTERFLKYEEYFKDKNVEIVYFPYTKGTSSTQLRNILNSSIETESE